MSAESTVSELATLVEREPDAFDFVRRITLERALFALAKDFALSEIGMEITGFSDDVLQELSLRSSEHPRSIPTVQVLLRILQKMKLISSGDPYITLDGEDIILEGRREIVVSLGSDLLLLLKEFKGLA